jgi:HK97 gp10 family phage protein
MAYKAKANEQAIQVDGLAQLFRALKEVGAPIEAIEEANRAAAIPVMKTAQQIAPVQSGRLRKSIRIGPAKTNVKIRAGMKRIPYANPIHWGWFYDKKNFITKNIKPNPFMARALGYNRDEILMNYVKSMKKLIDKYEPPASIKKWW